MPVVVLEGVRGPNDPDALVRNVHAEEGLRQNLFTNLLGLLNNAQTPELRQYYDQLLNSFMIENYGKNAQGGVNFSKYDSPTYRALKDMQQTIDEKRNIFDAINRFGLMAQALGEHGRKPDEAATTAQNYVDAYQTGAQNVRNLKQEDTIQNIMQNTYQNKALINPQANTAQDIWGFISKLGKINI
ncbi:hypothetical protein [Caldisericum sp.]|uniref:hypothetical protein n=1 Tax=Caldisericum sp. TaxID=2499687 RepID=UPI003D0EE925